MGYPESPEMESSDGSKKTRRRPSYYNEEIKLNSYSLYVTSLTGSLSSVKVAKELIIAYKDEVEIILLNKSKVQVICKTARLANLIIKAFLTSKTLNFYIPQQKVEVKGRICLPKNISEKEAFEGMTVKNRIATNAPLPSIVEVYRVPYFDKDPSTGVVKRMDSDFMLVSFCGSHVPTHVVFENALLIPVQAYFEPILQCKNCWFFGHSKGACRGKERCVACGLIHSGDCIVPAVCVNCRGDHSSNSKNCPEFLKRKELSKAKALKTVPMGINTSMAPALVPASFNFHNVNFPGLPTRSLPVSSSYITPSILDNTLKKRRADNNVVELEEAVKISSPESTMEVTNKIVRQLSNERSFFSAIVKDVKNSVVNGEELETRICEKIKEFMSKSVSETTTDPMGDTNGAVAGSSRS